MYKLRAVTKYKECFFLKKICAPTPVTFDICRK